MYDHMTELGLAREAPGGRLTPVSPAKAVEGLVEKNVGRFRRELEESVDSCGIVDSLLAEHEKSVEASLHALKTSDATQHIEGMAAVRAAIDELTFFTRTESLTVNPRGILSEESISHARPLDARILRREVHMRTLMGSSALGDPGTMSYLRELVALGADIRISYQPLERLIICDRTAALTPMDPANTSRGAILTRDPGLVSALVSLFERMWQSAHALPDTETELKHSLPSPLEQQILHSLCNAEKDEIGARNLGIAVRTYRKHVASILLRLGAANRFQAALLARERGWV
ncbi:helix-turn-helix transcriptional regulator [Streptomyces sp. NPDC002779]|uniref:helix-turn-helix transcriptional regulator n=1 Tax=Streptomyces sp. NPDC002779 TaxID=3364664 RepID=UPI0036A51492